MQVAAHRVSPPPTSPHASAVLRMPAVVRHPGLARSTIYRLMAVERFSQPVRLAKRAMGWRRADLDRRSAALPTADHC